MAYDSAPDSSDHILGSMYMVYLPKFIYHVWMKMSTYIYIYVHIISCNWSAMGLETFAEITTSFVRNLNNDGGFTVWLYTIQN